MRYNELIIEFNQQNKANLDAVKNAKDINMGFEIEFITKTNPYSDKFKNPKAGYEFITNNLSKFLNLPFEYKNESNEYGSAKYDGWTLTKDSSVKYGSTEAQEKHEDRGFEIVSPILPVQESLQKLRFILSKIDNSEEYFTNGTTGLHINLSFKELNKTKQIDPLKMVLFVGEDYLKKLFQRDEVKDLNWDNEKIDYVGSIIPELINELHGKMASAYRWEQNKDHPISQALSGKNVWDWIEKAKESTTAIKDPYSINSYSHPAKYKYNKSFTIALTKLARQNYVEFRVMGGADYEKRINEVFITIGRFIRSIEIASDPNAYKQEYIKKVTKLLKQAIPTQPSEHDAENHPNMDADVSSLETFESILVKYNRDTEYKLKMLIRWIQDKNYSGVIILLHEIYTDKDGKIKNDPALRRLLHNLLKKYGFDKQFKTEVIKQQNFDISDMDPEWDYDYHAIEDRKNFDWNLIARWLVL